MSKDKSQIIINRLEELVPRKHAWPGDDVEATRKLVFDACDGVGSAYDSLASYLPGRPSYQFVCAWAQGKAKKEEKKHRELAADIIHFFKHLDRFGVHTRYDPDAYIDGDDPNEPPFSYETAYNDGYKAGEEAGYKEGKEVERNAQEAAFKTREEAAYKAGVKAGFKAGHEAGFSEGQTSAVTNYLDTFIQPGEGVYEAEPTNKPLMMQPDVAKIKEEKMDLFKRPRAPVSLQMDDGEVTVPARRQEPMKASTMNPGYLFTVTPIDDGSTSKKASTLTSEPLIKVVPQDLFLKNARVPASSIVDFDDTFDDIIEPAFPHRKRFSGGSRKK